MTINDVYDRALDWLWAAVAGAFVVVSGAVVRLWRHEERIKALETANEQKIEFDAALSAKVDKNHTDLSARIDALGDGIRADLRIIMSRCLAAGEKDCP